MQREVALRIIMALLVIALVGAFLYFVSFSPKDCVKVYFFKGDRLRTVIRKIPKREEKASFALRELLQGPRAPEKRGGFFSEIPAGVKALNIDVQGDTATLNFNNKLAKYGGGSARVQGLIAQIVYTLTDIKGIDKVRVLIEGKSDVVLGGEGYVIDRPLGRRDVHL